MEKEIQQKLSFEEKRIPEWMNILFELIKNKEIRQNGKSIDRIVNQS